ncbi:hypothetical protein FRB90_011980 [Tulasnella sp. 427]|nr:hypothetical protein FRB90_011980 [Tulasnella sp. 427]
MATTEDPTPPGNHNRTQLPTTTIGHLSTGETPVKLRSVRSEATRLADEADQQLLCELHGKLFSTLPRDFIRQLLYERVAESQALDLIRYKRDKRLAARCFKALEERTANPQFNHVVRCMEAEYGDVDIAEKISSFLPGKGFIKFNEVREEKQLYNPLVAILEFISHFFRLYFNKREKGKEANSWSSEIDRSWPVATCPSEVDTSPSQDLNLLRRTFVNTDGWTFSFSAHVKHSPTLRPDLSLVLCQKPDIQEFAAIRNAMDTKAQQDAETKENADSKIDIGRMHWKDVKIPIEVKLDHQITIRTLCQMARYAQAVKTEQFDRNCVPSLMISRKVCHVFHWGASRCHLAEVDIVKDTTTFIHIIGRLATMNPESMGYDSSFSNAGRVLAREKETIETMLQVLSREPAKFYDQPSEAESTIKLRLIVNEPIYEQSGLFSRCTRAWEGHEIVGNNWEGGPVRVVKQNWANIKRINEAFLYQVAKDVPGVARLVGHETLVHSDICLRWGERGILGEWRKGPRRKLEPYEIDEPLVKSPLKRYPRPDPEGKKKRKGKSGKSGERNENGTEKVEEEQEQEEKEQEQDQENDEEAQQVVEEGLMDKNEKEGEVDVEAGAQNGSESGGEELGDRVGVPEGVNDETEDEEDNSEDDGGVGDSEEGRQNDPFPQIIRRVLIPLFELEEEGIIHRDVSIGNLMLNEADGEEPPQDSSTDKSPDDLGAKSQPFLIDLGLAIWSPPSADDASASEAVAQGDPKAQGHAHLTGTLPFISHEALQARTEGQASYKHSLLDDIESVFWVLLYLALIEERTDVAEKELAKFHSLKPDAVLDVKLNWLYFKLSLNSKDIHRFKWTGRFKDLTPFLRSFSQVVLHRLDEATALETITAMIDDAIAGLPENSGGIVNAGISGSVLRSRQANTLQEHAESHAVLEPEFEAASQSETNSAHESTSSPHSDWTEHSQAAAHPKRKRKVRSIEGARKKNKQRVEDQ